MQEGLVYKEQRKVDYKQSAPGRVEVLQQCLRKVSIEGFFWYLFIMCTELHYLKDLLWKVILQNVVHSYYKDKYSRIKTS